MSKKQKKTHRADGHYYLTLDILRDNCACHSGVRLFVARTGARRGGRNVSVTLELLEKLSLHAEWAAHAMYDKGLVAQKEMQRFLDELYEDGALAFMNLLERRAVREGRLSSAMK